MQIQVGVRNFYLTKHANVDVCLTFIFHSVTVLKKNLIITGYGYE